MLFFFIGRETAEWWADAFTGFRFRDVLPFYFDKSNPWGLRVLLACYFTAMATGLLFFSCELVWVSIRIISY